MMARLLGVTPRTVRRWKAARVRRARGRPAKRPERRAVWAVARAWRRMGRSAGWRPVHAALAAVSRRHVQLVVGALKRRRRARAERRRERLRTRLLAAGRDVLWSLDATHLGRDATGRVVEGQAVREVATTRTLALSAGGAHKYVACNWLQVMFSEPVFIDVQQFRYILYCLLNKLSETIFKVCWLF